MKKSEAIQAINQNPELGVVYGRVRGCQLMTFREFLSWYEDTSSFLSRIKDQDIEPDSDEYYELLEQEYDSDNGAGGIWYPEADLVEVDNDWGFNEEE